MPSQQLDNFMAYNILVRLSRPFVNWEACKAGIIDANGNVLKKQAQLSSPEKEIFGKFDLICLNLKKIIDKIPQYKVASTPLNLLQAPPFPNNIGSNISLGVLSGSFFLLKEEVEDPDNISYLEERLEYYYNMLIQILEDGEGVPANNAGSGNIAGIGVGPSGEPGVPPNTPYKKKNKKEELKFSELINKLKRA